MAINGGLNLMGGLLGSSPGYVRTVWENEVTPLDADHMNNIELGISEIHDSYNTNANTGEVGIKTNAVAGQALTLPHGSDGNAYVGDVPLPAIHISTADPTAADGEDGDVWIKYTV